MAKLAIKEETVKEVKPEVMEYTLKFSDGTVIDGSTSIREFQPNVAKGFHNSGYQVKVSNGAYSGNIMVIDSLKQKKL